jgi:hypothetical protein
MATNALIAHPCRLTQIVAVPRKPHVGTRHPASAATPFSLNVYMAYERLPILVWRSCRNPQVFFSPVAIVFLTGQEHLVAALY